MTEKLNYLQYDLYNKVFHSILMITTIKVETSTAKALKLSKIKYMGKKSVTHMSNDKYIMVLLGKNKK
tara:strand:- start:481 stop:684 length:204 start_codon:yes stop_codon:yes gene_type:complete